MQQSNLQLVKSHTHERRKKQQQQLVFFATAVIRQFDVCEVSIDWHRATTKQERKNATIIE